MAAPYYLTELDRRDLGSWHDSVASAAREADRLIRASDTPLWFGITAGVTVELRVSRVDHVEASHADVIVPLPVPSPVPENYRPTDVLDREAHALYAHECPESAFREAFTVDELARLAELCVFGPDGSGGRGYDDEVFDALHLSLDAAWAVRVAS